MKRLRVGKKEAKAIRIVGKEWREKGLKPEEDPIGFAMEVDAKLGKPWGGKKENK